MKKKILVLNLALTLVCSYFGESVTFAAEKEDYQTSILAVDEEETEVIFNEVHTKETDGTKKSYWVVNDASVNNPKARVAVVSDYLKAEQTSLIRYVGVKRGLNIRTFPNIKYKNIYKALPYGTKVHVVGISEKGWVIIEIKGEKYFCWGEYLTIEKPAAISTSLLGTYSLTAYCNCSKCCGKWAGGKTASGTIPTQGRTIACNSLPLGTKVRINGQTYTVEDTGNMSNNVIDIYFNSHSEALQFGRRSAKVYLVN